MLLLLNISKIINKQSDLLNIVFEIPLGKKKKKVLIIFELENK
jgi:hypothetical protein